MTVVNEKLVFLHVPKTGGTWAERAMAAAGVELEEVGIHADVAAVAPYKGRFRFAFVREPLSWYRSWWTHRHTFHDWKREEPLDEIGRAPFEEFLAEAMVQYPGYVSDLFEQFAGPPGVEIEFVGRYEGLLDDLVHALELAGERFDEQVLRGFPAVNVSSSSLDVECSPPLQLD